MMPEKVVPGPVSEERCIREACVYTRRKFLIPAKIKTVLRI